MHHHLIRAFKAKPSHFRPFTTTPRPQALFIVIAKDGQDSQALSRRLAVRESHLARTKAAYAQVFGDEGECVGVGFSESVCGGGVWREVEVKPFLMARLRED
ncbi:hypothetical protein BC829DRAFT_404170 [Chytridium lagenaria]|nr:hypothetical protein BC829DRAFT_404170 [Chytridium lagenaria]